MGALPREEKGVAVSIILAASGAANEGRANKTKHRLSAAWQAEDIRRNSATPAKTRRRHEGGKQPAAAHQGKKENIGAHQSSGITILVVLVTSIAAKA